MYVATCECGADVTVEATDAGGMAPCTTCRKTFRVPSLSKLKVRAGESNPFLSSVNAVQSALTHGQAPFDGVCPHCKKTKATQFLPISFNYLDALATPDGGVVTNRQVRVDFPLPFCGPCQQHFEELRASQRRQRGMKQALALVIAIPAFLLAFVIAWSLCLAIPALIFVLIQMLNRTTAKTGDPFVIESISQLPVVGPLVSQQPEYHLSVGSWQHVDV